MIALVGFMGAGKSTVGVLLAARLGVPFLDSDAVIERRAGRPISDIFATEGEAAFRQLEHDTVTGLLRGEDAVLALGGGAATHPGTRRALRAVTVVYLHVDYQIALRRLGGDRGRPLLRRPDLEQRYLDRLPVYREVATVAVDTDTSGPGAVCREVLARLPACATVRPGAAEPSAPVPDIPPAAPASAARVCGR